MRDREEVLDNFMRNSPESPMDVVNNQRLILEVLLDIRDQREVKIEYIKKLMEKFTKGLAERIEKLKDEIRGS